VVFGLEMGVFMSLDGVWVRNRVYVLRDGVWIKNGVYVLRDGV